MEALAAFIAVVTGLEKEQDEAGVLARAGKLLQLHAVSSKYYYYC